MKLAIVGATGMVGGVMLDMLAERKFYFDENCLFAVRNDSLWWFCVRQDSILKQSKIQLYKEFYTR